jgi:hypothetical protein
MMSKDAEYVSIFDGATLDGWVAVPRIYGNVGPGGPRVLDAFPDFRADYNEKAAANPAAWRVEDGAIVGTQRTQGWGGYLVSEATYGDFELRLEMKPDWPADTGVMIRRRFDAWDGIQVLVDHRQEGSIGGFYGNGIGGFHAYPSRFRPWRSPAHSSDSSRTICHRSP